MAESDRAGFGIGVGFGVAIGLVCTAALAASIAVAQPTALTQHASEPRAFGYTVGDVVSRQVRLVVPDGLTLDETSLPRIGGRGRALELRRVELLRSVTGAPRELRLDYQVFLSPKDVRVLEMPPIELRFDGKPRAQTLRIDAWPVTVSPLAPVDPSPREGLGEMRPDRAPPPIDTTAARTRLALYAALATALLAYLAHVYLGAPWWARRRRPFGLAWRALRALPSEPTAEQRRAAFEQVHAALNASAEEVLFEPGVDRFIAGQPRFAGLRGELVSFFHRSRAEFFGGGGEPGDARWLVDFARRCRDAERGAA